MTSEIIWFIVAIILATFEIFSTGFFFACFSIGALFACIPGFFDWGILWEVIFFTLGSILSLFLIRPLFNRKKDVEKSKTGIDALIGKKAKVIRKINGVEAKGRIAIDGDEWLAISENGMTIEEGSIVEIIRNESLILYVREISNK